MANLATLGSFLSFVPFSVHWPATDQYGMPSCWLVRAKISHGQWPRTKKVGQMGEGVGAKARPINQMPCIKYLRNVQKQGKEREGKGGRNCAKSGGKEAILSFSQQVAKKLGVERK
jgi:hypothetical protein